MPTIVRKRRGKRLWDIKEKRTGRIVGTSKSKRKARISSRIRNQYHRLK